MLIYVPISLFSVYNRAQKQTHIGALYVVQCTVLLTREFTGSKEEELKLIHLISDFVTPSVDPLDVIGGTIDTQVYKNLKILCPAQGMIIQQSAIIYS